MRMALRSAVETLPKLVLLHGRPDILSFRPYLHVMVPQHRIALTRMLVSDHPLAVERLRWAKRYRPPVPWHERLCRLCRDALDDSPHTMLECSAAADPVALRDVFWGKVGAEWARLRSAAHDPAHALALLMARPSLHGLVAKLAYDALEVYARVPI
ncbi:hypothetical protein OBBRIDRAFT_791423 [Obba rivulosa]|uniref:Uncharacterized protein n=1 Tax=Obba rivulosa TaxID=1052685 RepID=A0A8E2B282_9APHY|nr:hypothetical protein OBBRIDRAFT_791423 [Obba rivulosa]